MNLDVRTGGGQKPGSVGRGWGGLLILGDALVQLWGLGLAK